MKIQDLLGKTLILKNVTDTYRGGAQSTCLTFKVLNSLRPLRNNNSMKEVKVSFSPSERGGDLSCTVRQSIPHVSMKKLRKTKSKGLAPAIVRGLMEDER